MLLGCAEALVVMEKTPARYWRRLLIWFGMMSRDGERKAERTFSLRQAESAFSAILMLEDLAAQPPKGGVPDENHH
jgi:hypothetical protein